MRRILLLSILLLAACDSRSEFTYMKKDPHVKSLSEIKANLAFTCVHEKIPAATAESEVLFQYARWLQRNNQLKQDQSVNAEIERLYRIAAENGHYKANINLQNGTMRGHFKLRGDEHLRLSQQLIDAGVATGYYFIGIFLKNGSAGLQQEPEMSLRYFRKAADQGSAQAQPDSRLHYLGQQEDVERAERYKTIWRILANYSYADPKVPEINEILPLPPAKLPAWDAKLQWLEARLANVPPKKPGEALIQQLAKAMLLEPATGRATAVSSALFKASYPDRPVPAA